MTPPAPRLSAEAPPSSLCAHASKQAKVAVLANPHTYAKQHHNNCNTKRGSMWLSGGRDEPHDHSR